MTSVDDCLREQSKLLLRKLKDKQSQLQDIVNTSLNEDPSSTEMKSPPSITYVKQKANRSQVKTPVRRFVPDGKTNTSVKEKLDESLQKLVLDRSGREGRSRLHKKRTKSKEEKDRTNLKNYKTNPEEEKENLVKSSIKKKMASKVIDTSSYNGYSAAPTSRDTNGYSEATTSRDTNGDSEATTSRDTNGYSVAPMSQETNGHSDTMMSRDINGYRAAPLSRDTNGYSEATISRDMNRELSDIRQEVETEFLENLKHPVDDKEKDDTASGSSATPNTLRRRRIIDRNVRVNNPRDLNASELMRECEEEFPRLNYSYSNVEDSDLKFLQERLGTNATGTEGENDDVPVRDMDPDGATYGTKLDNPGNSRTIAKFIRDTKKPKSILLSNSRSQNKSSTGNTSRVSFRSPTRDNSGNLTYQMDSYSKQQQKMLGYDWIAALIENDPNAMNQSETFFDELKEFRKLNLEECSNQMYMDSAQDLWEHPEREPLPVQRALEETKVKPYVVNDRLFCEPVQKSLFARHDYDGSSTSQVPDREPTYDEPRFVRVSIPRSTLMAGHRVKPHRRNSFDAADSMSLSKHCMKGWNTSQPLMMPASTNIALRDSTIGIKSSMKTTLDDAEKLAANYPYEWDPKEQSICRPLPRTTYRPESKYADSTWPSALKSNVSSFGQSSETLQRATDDLLNSTNSLMYEMKRLRLERSDDPIRL